MITGLFLAFIAIMLPSGAHAQGQNEFTIPLSDPAKRGMLKASLNSGSITIKGTARQDVLVRYSEQESDHDHDQNHDDDDENDGLRRIGGGGMDLEASENNNAVRVESSSWNTALNVEIEVPAGFDVEVSTYNNGDLMLSNIQGEVALTNFNGDITALNISGAVVATTYNGEIKVTFDKVKENTPMSFSTYNGDIDLSFPSTLKASFKMKSQSGDIYTDFDMKVTSTGPKQTRDSKSGSIRIVVDDWQKGDVNGGGAEIAVKNYNGDIYLRKK